jgi:hypothetical protein
MIIIYEKYSPENLQSKPSDFSPQQVYLKLFRAVGKQFSHGLFQQASSIYNLLIFL